MKNPQLALLTAIITSLPALLYAGFILGTRGEYYFPAYAAMAAVFWVASVLAGVLVAVRLAAGSSRRRVFMLLLIGSAIAWLLALGVLMALSLTPLCVGQDNGDGRNDLISCMVQVGFVSILYTPPALVLSALASLVASRLFPGKSDRNSATSGNN